MRHLLILIKNVDDDTALNQDREWGYNSKLGKIFLWMVIFFGTLGFYPFSLWGYYTQMDDEIFECLAAFSYLSFSILDLQIKLKGLNIGAN